MIKFQRLHNACFNRTETELKGEMSMCFEEFADCSLLVLRKILFLDFCFSFSFLLSELDSFVLCVSRCLRMSRNVFFCLFLSLSVSFCLIPSHLLLCYSCSNRAGVRSESHTSSYVDMLFVKKLCGSNQNKIEVIP